MKSNLSEAERTEVRGYWNMDDASFDASLNDHVPTAKRDEIERVVLMDMAEIGHVLDPDPRVDNLYGAELTERKSREIAAWLATAVFAARNDIHTAVCEDFRYCERRAAREFETEGAQLAISLADALLVLQTTLPMPVTALAVYLLKKHLLDVWCECSPST